jgi:hypothetical protein
MKNLFEAARAGEVKQRIAQLRPDSERLWGKMNPAQALEHCSRGMEMALGDKTPPRVLVGRIMGWMVKPMALGNDEPMRRNSPTAKELVVQDERDLVTERARLCGLIDRFCRGRTERVHQASACLLWAANAGGVGDLDVQASGPSSAAVWSIATRNSRPTLARSKIAMDEAPGRTL